MNEIRREKKSKSDLHIAMISVSPFLHSEHYLAILRNAHRFPVFLQYEATGCTSPSDRYGLRFLF